MDGTCRESIKAGQSVLIVLKKDRNQLMPTEYIEFNLGNRYSAEAHLGNEFGSHNDLLRRFKKKGACKTHRSSIHASSR